MNKIRTFLTFLAILAAVLLPHFSSSAQAAEIQILGNNLEILDGDATPRTEDFTFFGVQTVGAGNIAKTFTIRNTSGIANDNLGLSGTPRVVIGGGNSADFVVTTQPAASVGPGASTTFVITWTPTFGGIHNATLSIANNDSNENPYNFAIQATAQLKLTYTAGANGTLTGTTPQIVYSTATGSAVTAVPATGYRFVNWSDGFTANPRTDTPVTANVSVTANFALNPMVNLSVSANTGSETAATTITVTATASIPVSGVQTIAVSGSGTGVTTGDYVLSNATITIPNGQTSGSVTFTVANDTLVESTETATLTLSAPSDGIALGSTTTQAITITDNDSAYITLSPGTAGTSENAGIHTGTVLLRITAGTALQDAVTINLTSVLLGTATPGDFTLSTSSVTFPAGSVDNATQSFSVAIVNDNLVESFEFFDIEIVRTGYTGVPVITGGGPSGDYQQTIRITDNDAPASVTITGGNNQSTSVSTAFTSPLAVLVKNAANIGVEGANVAFTAPGSGASGTSSNGTVTITVATDATGTASASFTANAIIGAYNVTAAAGTPSAAFALMNGAPTVTTPTSAAITAITATLGGNVTSDGGVTVSERGVVYAPTATNADPLIGGTGVVKVTASGTTGIFTAPVSGLAANTGYSYKAYATNSAGTSYTTVASFTTLSLPTVNLSVSANSGSETAATAITVTATASRAVSGNQTVALTVSGTGVTSGDYVLSSASIAIPNGQTSGSVTFTVTNDTLVESTETATLSLSAPSSGVILGSTTPQAVVITDNDAPASVSVTNGNNQTAAVSSSFTSPLAVLVKNAANIGVQGAPVTFTAPDSGASGTFSNSTRTITVPTDATGTASASLTANASTGTYNVTATAGTPSATLALTNAPPAPVVDVLSPNTGLITGGTSVTISGANLLNASSVTFGGTVATIGSITATSITVTTPAHAVGAVNVVVTTEGGSSTDPVTFTYIATLSALESWRETYFGPTATNTGTAADAADPYSTGVPNLLVFAFFGPTQDPAAVRLSQLPQVTSAGGFLTYQFTEPAGVSGITYRAESSATLGNDWQPVTDTGNAPEHLFSVPIGGAKKFLRLSVTSP